MPETQTSAEKELDHTVSPSTQRGISGPPAGHDLYCGRVIYDTCCMVVPEQKDIKTGILIETGSVFVLLT